MEKIEQKSIELQIAEQLGDIIYRENKTLAKLSFLENWKFNPKFSDEKDIKKLESKIEKAGFFKPLVICMKENTNHAIVLGGNQRLIALKNLHKRYKEKYPEKYGYIWVSIVNPENDTEKKVYSFLDNEEIGKYDREKLKALIDEDLKQTSLFDSISLKLDISETAKEIMDRITISQEEYQFKSVAKNLKSLGINDETINAIQSMTNFSKTKEGLENVDIKGKICGQKLPLMFWVEDETLFQQLTKIFYTGYKDKYNTDKLVELCKQALKIEIPTAIDVLEEKLKVFEDTIELMTPIQKQEAIDNINKLYKKIFQV